MRYQTVIFDLDGTLTDSAEGIVNSVIYALSTYGIEETDRDALKSFVGPPLIDSFMRRYGFSKEKAEEALARFRVRFTKIGIFEISLYEDDDYEYSQNWAKENVSDSYQETEVAGFKGYSYSTASEYTLILPLEEVEEGTFRYVELELQIDGNAEETKNFFNENKDIQSIMNSFKYLGDVEE